MLGNILNSLTLGAGRQRVARHERLQNTTEADDFHLEEGNAISNARYSNENRTREDSPSVANSSSDETGTGTSDSSNEYDDSEDVALTTSASAITAPSLGRSEEIGVSSTAAVTNLSEIIGNSTDTSDDENSVVSSSSSTDIGNTIRLANNRSSTVSLAELEEERELARRRTSACVLLAVFVLLRLWVEALKTSDFGLLLLCLMGTSWTARWIRHNREREEELDRRIQAYLENSEPGTTEVDRNDLRMLSFQAQLALAIMESQRQMIQGGGYGHSDGHSNSNGISDEAKSQWESFKFKKLPNTNKNEKGNGYGSVALKDASLGEEPACSICLGEYDHGEDLVRLPCNHIYHAECIASWTNNNVRCPLCNLDLESAPLSSESRVEGSIV